MIQKFLISMCFLAFYTNVKAQQSATVKIERTKENSKPLIVNSLKLDTIKMKQIRENTALINLANEVSLTMRNYQVSKKEIMDAKVLNVENKREKVEELTIQTRKKLNKVLSNDVVDKILPAN